MNKKEIKIEYYEYLSKRDMDRKDRDLVDLAEDALERAYAPYSKFSVGASVRLVSGEVISASNQENAAYPSGLCAERTAIFYAQSKYPDIAIESIAIAASADGSMVKDPIPPCGACRQVMVEAEKRGGAPISVIMSGAEKAFKVNDIKSLMPFVFDEIPEK